MKVLFTEAARAESLEAFDYYQQRSELAANRFIQSLQKATNWLSCYPTTGKPLSARTRRNLMKTFPYLVIDRITPEALWIIGIVHEKRDPTHWRHLL